LVHPLPQHCNITATALPIGWKNHCPVTAKSSVDPPGLGTSITSDHCHWASLPQQATALLTNQSEGRKPPQASHHRGSAAWQCFGSDGSAAPLAQNQVTSHHHFHTDSKSDHITSHHFHIMFFLSFTKCRINGK
jgi:hypothetical protein